MTYIQEEWKPVVGFEGYYEVSNFGRVKRIAGGSGATPGKILGLKIDRYGYVVAALSRSNSVRHRPVHKLVAEAFFGQCPLGHEVNHRDGNKANPFVMNLEYLSKVDHKAWTMRAGQYPKGTALPHAKLSENDIVEIRALRGVETARALAKRFNVSPSCISTIQLRKWWKHVL